MPFGKVYVAELPKLQPDGTNLYFLYGNQQEELGWYGLFGEFLDGFINHLEERKQTTLVNGCPEGDHPFSHYLFKGLSHIHSKINEGKRLQIKINRLEGALESAKTVASSY